MGQATAIVLGGTLPHIDLIKKLKKRGYYVLLVDYLCHPIAAPYADEHVMVSTLDCEAVLALSRERKAEIVISACVDQANATACYVMEQLGRSVPYSYETALRVTNKKLMKKVFVENDIPTASYYTVTNVSNLKRNMIAYPVVVKPADCNSSKGVTKVNDDKELVSSTEKALQFSRTHTAIVEEFIEGTEIHIDCNVHDGVVQVLLTKQKKKAERISGISMNHYGSLIPAQLSEIQYIEVCEIAQKIVNAFHLKNTPMFYQAIVNDEGIHVLEFAPRIGGGLGAFLLERVVGVDIMEVSIDSYLGIPTNVLPKKSEYIYSTNLIYVEAGIYGGIQGLEEMKAKEETEGVFIYQNPGEYIDGDMKSGNRIAAYVLRTTDYDTLKAMEMKLDAGITVYDIDGIPMKKK